MSDRWELSGSFSLVSLPTSASALRSSSLSDDGMNGPSKVSSGRKVAPTLELHQRVRIVPLRTAGPGSPRNFIHPTPYVFQVASSTRRPLISFEVLEKLAVDGALRALLEIDFVVIPLRMALQRITQLLGGCQFPHTTVTRD